MLAHRYGDDVRIFDDPFLLSLLARLGAPETGTAEVPSLVRSAYHHLAREVLNCEFPKADDRVATRMTASEPKAFWSGRRLCQKTQLVLCAVIRAGILPAQVFYEAALEVLPAENVRIDCLNMSRVVDGDGHVTGVRMDGSKIGGMVQDALVVIPDPMGATGGTVARALQVYRQLDGGPPRGMAALHLMVTPEAVQRLVAGETGARLYAARLDRGLSSERALRAVPGEFPDEERGLNDVHYIVPGAGGMGELMTNSWV